MPYMPPQPRSINADNEQRLTPGHPRDAMRRSPPMLILRALERLDEALAQKRDPWPAYYAWTKTLDAWALGDAEFERDMTAAHKRRSAVARSQHGLEYAYQAVSMLSVPYIKLMRRLGVFKELTDLAPRDDDPQTSTP